MELTADHRTVLARHGLDEVVHAWDMAEESLARIAEELYQGTTEEERQVLRKDLLDCLCDLYTTAREQSREL